jgi:phosphatidylserine decarboxylase
MSTTYESIKVIASLKKKLKQDDKLAEMVVASLRKAKKAGRKGLKPDLYAALNWPEDLDEYFDYLAWFAKWQPQQSTDKAWTAPGTDEQQEVYDRLCHFSWLIDQPLGRKGKIVENNEWFSKWLVAYADAWGSFLNTTESFSQEILDSFINDSPEYRVQDSLVEGQPNSPSGWLTFNQFFARELNPGLRPISSPDDNAVIASPADCTFRAKYDIGADSSVPGITVKKTHKFANVKDLLDSSQYADAFANGTFVHYFLGPYSYHRFHTPVAGLLKECRKVNGRVYLDVQLSKGQFDAPDNSEGGYEFAQSRGIVILDTSGSAYGDVGLVGVVPVGMCQVSSVNMTAVVGNNMLKGDEFGYFLFGGSDTILLFQEGVNPEIFTGSTYRHYGTAIASCDVR